MEQYPALRAAVKDRPHDSTPKLVMADYLEDQGLPHHAQVWRHLSGEGEGNPRAGAYAASEKAWDHSVANRIDGRPSPVYSDEHANSLFETNENEISGVRRSADRKQEHHTDPEASARHHLRLAENHDQMAEWHDDRMNGVAHDRAVDPHLNEYFYHNHGGLRHAEAHEAHTAAAHALSPGLRAHAATDELAATDQVGHQPIQQARRLSYSVAGLEGRRAAPNASKARVHGVIAALHEDVARETVPADPPSRHRRAGRHLDAARLHREAAEYYAQSPG